MQAKEKSDQGLCLPPGLLEIGDLAFFHCKQLASVAFPHGLRSIGVEAFVECPALRSVYFPETLEFGTIDTEEDDYSDSVWMSSDEFNLVFFSGYSTDSLPRDLKIYVKQESPARHHMEKLEYPQGMTIHPVDKLTDDMVNGQRIDKQEEDSDTEERAARAAEWLEEYDSHIDRDAVIEFPGKKFVFTGLSGWLSKVREDLNVIEEIQARGGLNRSTVSGQTDYLVVNPEGAGHGKVQKALEMKARGKGLKIVLLEDLKKSLYPVTLDKAPGEETVEAIQEPYQVRIDECVIENGTLLSYQGNETNILLPEGITAIGYRTFVNQLWLKSVVLPETVSEVGLEAFANCPSLERVVLPDSIRTIGRNAFSYCFSLEEIEMPAGLEKVESGTFLGCRNLKTIILKAGVKKIGAQAFSFCDSLIRAGDPRDTFPDYD